jgi:putative ABC transport system permease protein
VRPAFLLRMAVREVRTGWQRLLFFVLSIAVGVGALVGIASFSANLEGAIRREARTLMAADLQVCRTQPFAADTQAAIAPWTDAGARMAELAEMPSMAARVDGDAHAAGRAQGGARRLSVLRRAGDRAGAAAAGAAGERRHRGRGGAAAAAERGGRRIIKIGSREFRVAGLLRREPDRVAAAFSLGPRVLMDLGDVQAAGLITVGSRVRHAIAGGAAAGARRRRR